jgi:hypothetical protein
VIEAELLGRRRNAGCVSVALVCQVGWRKSCAFPVVSESTDCFLKMPRPLSELAIRLPTVPTTSSRRAPPNRLYAV